MTSLKLVTVLISVLLVAACGTQQAAPPRPNLTDSAVVRDNTYFSYDPYIKSDIRQGPELSEVRHKSLYLNAIRPTGKAWIYEVNIVDQYSGAWRFYDSARDEDGNALTFVSIDRKTDNCRYGCDFYETMSVRVTREYLESRKNRGLNIKIFGKAGERLVLVPSEYVSGFLQAVR